MDELKACPHCGNSVAELTNCAELEDCTCFESCAEEPFVCVVCNANNGGCGASGGYADSTEKAIEKWNRRAESENNPLTPEQLRKMDGEPIDIKYIEYVRIEGTGSKYIPCSKYKFVLENYGKTWLAYARKPEQEEK